MATLKKEWLVGLILVGVIVVVAAGVTLSRRPAPSPAASPASSWTPSCTTSAACGPGFRCVVPGVCSRVCTADRDCPAGRRCAELRVMEGAEAAGEAVDQAVKGGAAAPALATTCVLANPG